MKRLRLAAVLSILLAAAPSGSAGETDRDPFAIDLATALKLADLDNTKVALAREKIAEAEARLLQARTLLLPDLSAGASYHRHEGPLQETNGNVLDVDRSSRFAGLGAGAVGAGDVQIAGVGLKVDLAEAFYAPLAARQRADSARAESDAVRNRVLFETAAAWYELLRARGALQIAGEAHENAKALADATNSFAETGQGLESDSERAAVEALVRERDTEVARENLALASIRLAALLRIDPATRLSPVGSADARSEWVDLSEDVAVLTDLALKSRPELAGSDAELAATWRDLERHRYSPLIPKLAVGASTGGFGGDNDASPGSGDQRTDVSAALYWQIHGLGLGQHAGVREKSSLWKQAKITRSDVEITVAAEVAAAFASARSRDARIAIGRDAIARARRSYELNRSRVFENQGLPIEVLQAIQSLVSARTLYLDSVIDYNLAQIQLYTALGQPVSSAEAAAENRAPTPSEAAEETPSGVADPSQPVETAPSSESAGSRAKRFGFFGRNR